jgi:ABC-type multidrug transport system ATPase subunit
MEVIYGNRSKSIASDLLTSLRDRSKCFRTKLIKVNPEELIDIRDKYIVDKKISKTTPVYRFMAFHQENMKLRVECVENYLDSRDDLKFANRIFTHMSTLSARELLHKQLNMTPTTSIRFEGQMLDASNQPLILSFLFLFVFIAREVKTERKKGSTILLLHSGVTPFMYIVSSLFSYLAVVYISLFLIFMVALILKSFTGVDTMGNLSLISHGLLFGNCFVGFSLFMGVISRNTVEILLGALYYFLSHLLVIVAWLPFYLSPSFPLHYHTISFQPLLLYHFLFLLGTLTSSILLLDVRNVKVLYYTWMRRLTIYTESKNMNMVKGMDIRNLCKSFGEAKVISSVNLTLESGNIYTICGKNGAGKSTLLNLLSGALNPSSGTVYLDGVDLYANLQRIRSVISHCAQENQYWDDLKVRHHVELFCILHSMDKRVALRNLELVELHDSRELYGRDLDLGMRRRLNLYLATLKRSKLILLDEPTAGVYPLTQKKLFQFIEALKLDAIVLVVSHYTEEIKRLSDHVILLQEGKVTVNAHISEMDKKMTLTPGPQMLFEIGDSSHKLITRLKDYFPEERLHIGYDGICHAALSEEALIQLPVLIRQAQILWAKPWRIEKSPFDVLISKDSQIPSQQSSQLYDHPKKSSSIRQAKTIFKKNCFLLAKHYGLTLTTFIIFMSFISLPYLQLQNFTFTSDHNQTFKESQAMAFLASQTYYATSRLGLIDFNLTNQSNTQIIEARTQANHVIGNIDQLTVEGLQLTLYNYLENSNSTTLSINRWEVLDDILGRYYHSILLSKGINPEVPKLIKGKTISISSTAILLDTFIDYLELAAFVATIVLVGRIVLFEKKRGLFFLTRLQGVSLIPLWCGTLVSHIAMTIIFSICFLMNLILMGVTFPKTLFLLTFQTYMMFLVSFSYVFTTFMRKETNFYFTLITIVKMLQRFREVNEEPWVFFNPVGLFRKILNSVMHDRVSVWDVYIPLGLIMGNFLIHFALVVVIEESKQIVTTSITKWLHHWHTQHSTNDCTLKTGDIELKYSRPGQQIVMNTDSKSPLTFLRNQMVTIGSTSQNESLYTFFESIPSGTIFNRLASKVNSK